MNKRLIILYFCLGLFTISLGSSVYSLFKSESDTVELVDLDESDESEEGEDLEEKEWEAHHVLSYYDTEDSFELKAEKFYRDIFDLTSPTAKVTTPPPRS